MPRWRWGIAVLAATSACALVADLGDRTLGDATRTEDGGALHEAGRPDAAADGGPTTPGPPPSFCDGIVLYASFDRGLDAERGGTSSITAGTAAASDAGRFGGGLSLVNPDLASDAGAAHYVVSGSLPKERGTVSLWHRAVPGAPDGGSPVVYRFVSTVPPATLASVGPLLLQLDRRWGVMVSSPGLATELVHVFDVAEVAPYLRPGGYNHFAVAWREPSDASADPTVWLAINGGLGEKFFEDGRSYANVVPTDAGDLRIPFRGYSSRRWNIVDAGPVALRTGAPTGVNALQGTLDDITVWNRVLSFEEISAVYFAGQAIGTLCR